MSDTGKRARDELIALRCRLGEPGAFAELVRELESPLLYYTTKILRDEHAALDVLQNVWITAFRTLRQLEDPAASLGDFLIDPRLDDALFGFEPPAGYSLTNGQNAGTATKPPLPTGSGAIRRTRRRRVSAPARRLGGIRQAASGARATRRGRCNGGPAHSDDHPRPQGVKLGDAGKLLVWFRPKGSAVYRAIFGDLHAADVTSDQLPKQPEPRPRAG
jgi:hypothetical protein